MRYQYFDILLRTIACSSDVAVVGPESVVVVVVRHYFKVDTKCETIPVLVVCTYAGTTNPCSYTHQQCSLSNQEMLLALPACFHNWNCTNLLRHERFIIWWQYIPYGPTSQSDSLPLFLVVVVFDPWPFHVWYRSASSSRLWPDSKLCSHFPTNQLSGQPKVANSWAGLELYSYYYYHDHDIIMPERSRVVHGSHYLSKLEGIGPQLLKSWPPPHTSNQRGRQFHLFFIAHDSSVCLWLLSRFNRINASGAISM